MLQELLVFNPLPDQQAGSLNNTGKDLTLQLHLLIVPLSSLPG